MRQGSASSISKCPGPFKALRCVLPEGTSCRIDRHKHASITTLPASTRFFPPQGYPSRQNTWAQGCMKGVGNAATGDGGHEVSRYSRVTLGELWHGFSQKGEQELVRMVHMAGECSKHAAAMEASAVCFSEVRQQGNTAGACQALVLLCQQGLVKDVPGLMSQLLDSFQAAAPLDVQACMLMLKTAYGMVETVDQSSSDMQLFNLLSRASAIGKQQLRLKAPVASSKVADEVSGLTARVSGVEALLTELRGEVAEGSRLTARVSEVQEALLTELRNKVDVLGKNVQVNSIKACSTAAIATTPNVREGMHVFKLRATRTGHKQQVNAAVFSPDGATLATGSADGTILIYSMPDGNYHMELNEHNAGVESLAISPDGRYLASGDCNGKLNVWDLHDKQTGTGSLSAVCCRKVASSSQAGAVISLAFSPDGTWLAGLSQKNSLIRIWTIQDVPAVDGVKQLCFHQDLALEGFRAWRVACHPKNSNLILGHEEDSNKTWDISGSGTWELRAAHSAPVTFFDLSSNGGVLVTASDDMSVHVFDASGVNLTDWAFRTKLEGHASSVWCVAVAADGTLAITGGAEEHVRVWNLKTGKCIKLLSGHTDTVQTVALSPDGAIAVSAGKDATVRIWQLLE